MPPTGDAWKQQAIVIRGDKKLDEIKSGKDKKARNPRGIFVSAYRTQLRVGFKFLRFFPVLETEYQQSQKSTHKSRIVVANSVAVISIIGFVLVDWFLLNQIQPVNTMMYLLYGCMPALLVPLVVMRIPKLMNWWRTGLYISSFFLLLTMSMVVITGLQEMRDFPTEPVLLVVGYVYFISGLFFYQAVTVSVLGSALFVAALLITGLRGEMVYYDAYYLLVMNAVGALGSYFYELTTRRSFLLESELKSAAYEDDLTGVMNRRAINAHLKKIWQHAIRESAAVGIAMVDLDNFKSINDQYGHSVGDAVLKSFAKAIDPLTRRPLDGIGRLSGDEFLLVWYNPNEEWFAGLGARVARSYKYQLKEDQFPSELTRVATASVGGVLVNPKQGQVPARSIEEADSMMYEAKNNGKNNFQYKRSTEYVDNGTWIN